MRAEEAERGETAELVVLPHAGNRARCTVTALHGGSPVRLVPSAPRTGAAWSITPRPPAALSAVLIAPT